MKYLITIITSLILFGTAYSQESKPVGKQERPKIVKTINTSMVGARTFSATAYALRGKMANGQLVHQGAIAADPRVLPIGTRVHIEGMGIFVVKDTGGAIKGSRIDIWMPSNRQALNFGRRNVKLTILK